MIIIKTHKHSDQPKITCGPKYLQVFRISINQNFFEHITSLKLVGILRDLIGENGYFSYHTNKILASFLHKNISVLDIPHGFVQLRFINSTCYKFQIDTAADSKSLTQPWYSLVCRRQQSVVHKAWSTGFLQAM